MNSSLKSKILRETEVRAGRSVEDCVGNGTVMWEVTDEVDKLDGVMYAVNGILVGTFTDIFPWGRAGGPLDEAG
jgi:hypothetical protein